MSATAPEKPTFTSALSRLIESPDAEVARLAAAPVGSINHSLAMLPVNITGPLDDLMIELPAMPHTDRTIVVVPIQRYRDEDAGERPKQRHRGSWRCVVIASDHPSYPVGGHRLAISEAELVRGRIRTLA